MNGKFSLQAVIFSWFFANFLANPTAWAAPSIPKEIRQHGLVYCTNASGFSLNPQKADVGSNMNVVTDQIYDKLFELDPERNTLKPALAERYEVSQDGRTITLFLRKKVAFHQTAWFSPNRHLNAEDVIFSLNRMMGDVGDLPNLNTPSEESAEFRKKQERAYQDKANLAHYPYFESIALRSKIADISAMNNYTVKIELNEPDNSLLHHLASQYAVILSKEYALELNADENLPQLDILPVGTGVYQLSSYAQNDYVRLTKNPHYWGKKANIENMVVDFSSDGTGRMAKLLNQECDVIAFPEPSQMAQFKDGNIVEAEGANLAFLAFNVQRPIMQDVALREKMAQAINKKRLIQKLYFAQATLAENVLPAVLHKSSQVTKPVDTANNSKKLPKFDRLNFWVVDEKRVFNLHPMKMAEMIKADLANIGIEVNITPVSRAYLADRIAKKNANYDLILTGWLANNADLNGVLLPLLSCSSVGSVTNLANWCNPYFDWWLNLAKLTGNKKAQAIFYHLAQFLVEQERPIVPLLNAKRILLVNKRVDDFKISPFGHVKLSEIKLKNK